MVKRKIAFLGTGPDAAYHPIAPLEEELTKIFAPLGDLQFHTDREAFLAALPGDLDLLVLLSDDWEKPLGDAAIAGLISWVAGGGSLLAIHQGISLQARQEFACLIGARFAGHPDAATLAFKPLGPLAKNGNLEAWDMEDEPYRFELDPFVTRDPLLEYRDAEGAHPAGWERRYCQGRVAYLSPGHDASNYAHQSYARLVRAVAASMLGRAYE